MNPLPSGETLIFLSAMLNKLLSIFHARTVRSVPPPELWNSVEETLAFLGYLSADERQQLRKMAVQFLSEKIFTGGAGFVPTDEVRLSIALQACLPILHLGLRSYAG